MKYPRRKITKEQQEALQKALSKRPSRAGMSARLFKGEDVEKHLSTRVEEVSKSLSESARQELQKSTKEAAKSLESRLAKQVSYAVEKMEEKVLLAIANIPTPKDGKTPDRTELKSVASEVLKELAAQNKKEDTDEKLPERDDNALLELIRSEAEKVVKGRSSAPSGGGPGYFYQLKDTPRKTRGTGPTYEGNEGKVLKVSSDGKSIGFETESSGGVTVETPSGTANGSNTDFTVTNEPKYVVVNALTYFEGGGYSYAGGTITFDIPPATGAVIRSIY